MLDWQELSVVLPVEPNKGPRGKGLDVLPPGCGDQGPQPVKS